MSNESAGEALANGEGSHGITAASDEARLRKIAFPQQAADGLASRHTPPQRTPKPVAALRLRGYNAPTTADASLRVRSGQSTVMPLQPCRQSIAAIRAPSASKPAGITTTGR